MRTQPIHDSETAPRAGPSGATDAQTERVEKFDEEGGDQPQAKSEKQVEEELAKARGESEHTDH